MKLTSTIFTLCNSDQTLFYRSHGINSKNSYIMYMNRDVSMATRSNFNFMLEIKEKIEKSVRMTTQYKIEKDILDFKGPLLLCKIENYQSITNISCQELQVLQDQQSLSDKVLKKSDILRTKIPNMSMKNLQDLHVFLESLN